MQIDISRKIPKQLLNKASGFLTGYSHTLNPYAGCSFACSYCYVRQMPLALFRKQEWGMWVDVKLEAAEQLKRELVKAKKKGPVTIFMSSSTDPYQPVEYKERVTRSLLEAMIQEKPDFLFVQTRSPLVTRDMDLFFMLKDRIRISMTVETDLEPIRKAFTPAAPPIRARLNALQEIADAGLSCQATIAPVLPSSSSFARTLAGIVDRVCIDDYFMGDGSKGKRTERLGIRSIYEHMNLEQWYSEQAYLRVMEQLKAYFREDQIFVSQAGFLP
jgi:DNA repair photolyase